MWYFYNELVIFLSETAITAVLPSPGPERYLRLTGHANLALLRLYAKTQSLFSCSKFDFMVVGLDVSHIFSSGNKKKIIAIYLLLKLNTENDDEEKWDPFGLHSIKPNAKVIVLTDCLSDKGLQLRQPSLGLANCFSTNKTAHFGHVSNWDTSKKTLVFDSLSFSVSKA